MFADINAEECKIWSINDARSLASSVSPSSRSAAVFAIIRMVNIMVRDVSIKIVMTNVIVMAVSG